MGLLESEIDLLIDAKQSVLDGWVSFEAVSQVLQKQGIDASEFQKKYASSVFDYYVGVVKKETEIGDCPVMAELLDFLKEHDVSSSELFMICTHFRRSMLNVMFDLGKINKELHGEISDIFDQNFSGVLDQYSERIFQAQRETRYHKRRFEEYTEGIDQSAMVSKTDLEGRITYVNALFSEISGYTKDELVGMPAMELYEKSETGSFEEEIWAQLHKKDIFNGIISSKKKDGEIYYTETTIVPLLDEFDEVEEYLCIRYDVSDLIKTRDAAVEAEKMKDQFLANMSHEVRTPLNAILGFVAVLRKRIRDPENSRYLDVISSSGESLLAIIGDILDFAKIKEGKLNVDPRPFDPHSEFANALELFSSKMAEKKIEYLTYIDPYLPTQITADEVRIKQILSNLLSNALKFTPEKGRVSVTIKVVKNTLAISIKDSGCGMEEEALDRIFSAFEQAEGSTTRKYGGTGLGLAISKKLCEMMGGSIEVQSCVDKGSLFRLKIPVKHSGRYPVYKAAKVYMDESKYKPMLLLRRYLEDMKMHLQADPSKESINIYAYKDRKKEKVKPYILVSSYEGEGIEVLKPAMSAQKIIRLIEGNTYHSKGGEDKPRFQGHVLIAEDNKANQMLMRLMLDEYGLSYRVCENGEEAYEAYKQEHFDLILMDEQMPVMNGMKATEHIIDYELQEKKVHTPIIAVTANALKGDEERFLEAGMDGYVAKPVESAKLEEIFHHFISKEGEGMSQSLELPSYANLCAEDIAAQIGLNAKHIPILVQSFMDESVSILADLGAAIEAGDFDAIANHAHSIKGSSGNLKFKELYELAKEMELSAKDSREDYPYKEALESIQKAISTISL